MYIQYGCGISGPSGWVNFDSSPTLLFERLPLIGRLYTKNESRFHKSVRFGDIVKGLPIQLGTCDGVYSSHVLEHLSLDASRAAIRNTFQLLKPRGIFRLVLPDLEFLVKQYLANPSSDAAMVFMRKTGLGRVRRPVGIKENLVSWLGNSHHLWMWDYESLEAELNKAGFTSIRSAHFGDSEDLRFKEVETKERWDNCLGIECKK